MESLDIVLAAIAGIAVLCALFLLVWLELDEKRDWKEWDDDA